MDKIFKKGNLYYYRMNIYNNIPEELKNKVDLYVQNNIKKYINENIFKELEIFHKNRLKKLFFNFYYKLNILYTNFEIDNNEILRDILFFLNHPYSQNMDTPFMSGKFTNKFINIMKRLNKNTTQIIIRWYRCYYLNSHYDDYQLEEKIISMLCYKYNLNKRRCTPLGKPYQEKKKRNINFIIDILNNLSIIELEKLYIYKMNEIGECNNKFIIENTLSFGK